MQQGLASLEVLIIPKQNVEKAKQLQLYLYAACAKTLLCVENHCLFKDQLFYWEFQSDRSKQLQDEKWEKFEYAVH